MTVSLLGLVEVRRALAVAPLAGRKVQAVVALLALSVSRPVSDDRLIDEVWSDDQLANRTNSLQAQVSNLRRVLGREAVVRQGAGYVLAIEPEDVDVLRFELLVERSRRLMADGDGRTAAQGFRTALSLIRGPPLGELLDFGFVQEVLPRIEEARLAAHEGLVDAELASGRHAEQVGPLVELVAHHPLRDVEALAHADEGLGHVGGGGSCWFAAELHRFRGEALVATGRLDAATTAMHRAVDVARAQGATALERRAVASLARCSTVTTTSEGR